MWKKSSMSWRLLWKSDFPCSLRCWLWRNNVPEMCKCKWNSVSKVWQFKVWKMSLKEKQHYLSDWCFPCIFCMDFSANLLQLNQKMRILIFNFALNSNELYSSCFCSFKFWLLVSSRNNSDFYSFKRIWIRKWNDYKLWLLYRGNKA